MLRGHASQLDGQTETSRAAASKPVGNEGSRLGSHDEDEVPEPTDRRTAPTPGPASRIRFNEALCISNMRKSSVLVALGLGLALRERREPGKRLPEAHDDAWVRLQILVVAACTAETVSTVSGLPSRTISGTAHMSCAW